MIKVRYDPAPAISSLLRESAKFVSNKGLSENTVLPTRITVASSLINSRGVCPLVNFQDGPIVPTIDKAPPDDKSHLDVIQITISPSSRKSGPHRLATNFCFRIVLPDRELAGRLVLKNRSRVMVRKRSRVQEQTDLRSWHTRGRGNRRRHFASGNDRICPSAANCRAARQTMWSCSTALTTARS